MRMTQLMIAVLGVTLLIPSMALAADGKSMHSPSLTWLAPQYRLEMPQERQSSDKSAEEMTLEERRAIQARLKLRRKMVDIHQVFANTTAASLVAADIIGMGNAAALGRGTPNRESIQVPLGVHRVLAATALTSYMAAGITAWTMPPALRINQAQKNKKKLDSGDLHVAFSVIHGIAMATVIATGILQANVAPAGQGWDALVATHTAAGLTAAGFVVAAGITIGTL
jgi:hypothetical protein